MTHASFNVPEYHGRPQPSHQIWHLRMGRLTAECRFWTHPLGAEIRVQVGAELIRSEALDCSPQLQARRLRTKRG